MNTRRLHPILWALIFLLMEVPAQSCGPDWPVAVFVKTQAPDAPYDAFTRGHLGVPQSNYRVRHLVIVYRYLNGLPLSHNEQTAALNANKLLNSDWENDQLHGHEGFKSWIAARNAFGPVDGFTPQNPLGTRDVWMMDGYFENCLDNAFANAAQTLHARQQAYGSRSSDIVEWVRGQDAVFHNCGKPQSASATLLASAPQWLRYDRAYQQAAALFYQHNYDQALKAFTAIAADSHSPWSTLSRYLVGRIMVTRAVNLETYSPPFNTNQSSEPPPPQRLNTYLDQLKAARAELLLMRREPQMQPLAHAIDAMIDRVNARLEPELQTRTLAMRLSGPTPDPNFYQDVLDLSYLLGGNIYGVNDSALNDRPKVAVPPPANAAERRGADMIAWIQALHSGNPQSIRQHWNDLHSTPWLLAALTFAKPDDPANAELLSAAAAVRPDDPAYPAAVYHRIRLSPVNPSTRGEMLAALPKLSTNETTSTRNLFAELNARSAPDLQTWLEQAARKPAAESTYGEEDEFDNQPAPQPCGPALLDKNTPLFAPDVATVLNTRLPLRLLAKVAESPVLPPNLRFQVAQAAWTRAVLLDRHDVAAQLSPILIRCNTKWQPILSTYDKASSPKDRKADALFALMRFASTEPNVREGNYRVDGFATYSLYRDNWWCFTIPPPQRPNTTQPVQDDDASWGFTSLAHPEIPDPLFLTSTDRTEAAQEIAALRRIPKASVYLAAQAFVWQRAYPNDPRAPELLGQAFRVVRNACTDKSSSDTEHRLFLTLHQQYPASHWTLRYRTWQ